MPRVIIRDYPFELTGLFLTSLVLLCLSHIRILYTSRPFGMRKMSIGLRHMGGEQSRVSFFI